MSDVEVQIQHAKRELLREIEVWIARIAGDRRIYRHLFLEGDFQVDARVFHGLLCWGDMEGLLMIRFLCSVERSVLMNAAIYQILAHPRG
jgi:hypothetical protein